MTIQKRQKTVYSEMFFAACEQFFHEPLFLHMDSTENIRLLIWSDNAVALREGLVAAASCGCMPDVRLDIEICGAAARSVEKSLMDAAPMFHEIFSREDTANIHFSETPTSFPPYVLCTEEKRSAVPQNVYCALLQPSSPSGELLRMAENLHYTFKISYGSSASLKEIIDDMYADNYNHASSVLQAAHLPVKLWWAGVRDKDIEEAAKRYTELLEADSGIMNQLVYLEHTRWSIFMALSGWKLPTYEEIKSYAFKEQPDGSIITSFRHNDGLLHPSLAACSVEGVDALEGHSGAKYWNGTADASHLDPLSQMSLWQHKYVSTIAPEHRCRAQTILNGIISSTRNPAPELYRLSEVINRLPSSAAELDKVLERVKEHLQDRLFKQLSGLLKSSIEAANRRSYLQGDIFSTKTIGFVLLFRRRFTKVIRMLSSSASDNIGALMQLDPEKAAFIVGPSTMDYSTEEERINGLETFVEIRNLRTELKFFEVENDDLTSTVGQALEWLGEDTVFDLTGAPMEFIAQSIAHKAFTLNKEKMVPSLFGKPFAIGALSTLPRTLRVADLFAALNRRTFKGWETPAIADIGNLIGSAFEAFIDLTKDEDPTSSSKYKVLFDQINNQFPLEPYQAKGKETQREFTLPAQTAVKRNVTGCLRRLQDGGFIRDLTVEAADEYKYTFVSRDWVHNNKKGVRLLDFLQNNPEENNYICSVKYKDKNQPRLKVVFDEFRIPEDMEPTIRAFSSCFEPCENGLWKFTSAAAKGLFSNEGNILEDWLWYQVDRNPYYRDVQLSFQFGLTDESIDKLEQEIDVIAITVFNRPVLFSCKLGAKGLTADSVKEIASHSRIYDINNPIPVLVTSASEAIVKNKGFAAGGVEREYLTKRGVRFIDRTILADEATFQRVLSEIACT